ncbi:cytochrome P450 [Mycobacterium sp. pUA109]|uniref:cytochrome P450 n=1 Tax=Mycobacterium sp. pUA109 TaxID=3238982 RepID=UPI00351BD530
MRDLGPVVWLPKQKLYALPRYAEVKSVLSDHNTFHSSGGVALNVISRVIGKNSVLLTDGTAHDRRRKLTAHRLTPRALRPLHTFVEDLAEQAVLAALAKGRVDGVGDIALKLPLSVVPDLVGWPERGREHLVGWAGATFDMLGPLNRLAIRSLPSAFSMLGFVHRLARRRDVLPGSMADELFQRVDEGTLKRSECPGVFIDYLAPSIDTTASAIAAALWLFARYRDQWQMLQADPTTVPNAVNEIVRLESPVRAFGRRTRRDIRIAGTRVPAGSRLLVMYASANRDERVWSDPDRFDITRDASRHVGFGHGTHGCAGQGLARLETQAILRSLIRHVDHIELDGTPGRAVNNVIHRFENLPIRLVPKGPST